MTSMLFKYNVILIVLCMVTKVYNHFLQPKDKYQDSHSIGTKEIDLYYDITLPQSRAILLTTEFLNVELNLIELNFQKNTKLAPKILDVNNQPHLPTLVNDNFILQESHAMLYYLVTKYDTAQTLLPDDQNMSARVLNIMGFENRILFPAFADLYYKWIDGDTSKTVEKEPILHQALDFLEQCLTSDNWVAGDLMTLADIILVADISTFEEVFGVDLKNYTKIKNWLQRCKDKLPGYQKINQKGIDKFKVTVDKMSKTGKNLDSDSTERSNEILLYYNIVCPLSRSVMLVAEALDVELTLIEVNFLEDIPNYPEIIKRMKINLKQSLPIFLDGDLVLLDSQAIMEYLVMKYRRNDILLPKNAMMQSQIYQIVSVINSTLYRSFKNQYYPWIFEGKQKTYENDDLIHIHLRSLNNMLNSFRWQFNSLATIADMALAAMISTFEVAGVDMTKYNTINESLERYKEILPGYQKINQAGINKLILRIPDRIKMN